MVPRRKQRWFGCVIRGLVPVAVLALSSCSTVKVRTDPDKITNGALRSTEVLEEVVAAPFDALADFAEETADLLRIAERSQNKGENAEAAGTFLKVATDAHFRLVSGKTAPGSDEEKALLKLYNSALSGFAARWIEDPRGPGRGASQYTCGDEAFEVRLAADSTYGEAYFDRLIPASGLKKKGIVNKTRDGAGAALVGIREQRSDRLEELQFFSSRGVQVPVTATIDSVYFPTAEGRVKRVTLSLRNPFLEETAVLGERSLPLAADFSAGLAMVLHGGNEVVSGVHGFFKADDRLAHSGIFLLEPYDPDRIPVLLIHGLFSVPMIWRDIIPEMACDPEIAKRFQFMLFTYPSSFPVIESAELLRDELAALRETYDPEGRDPLSRDLVVVGHSMGGVLTHTLIAEFGDNLWREYCETPLDELDLAEAKKEKIRKLVYFPPDPGVTRAVYYSTPHRGSVMANKRIARMISRTAKLPANVVQFTTGLIGPPIESIAAVPTGAQTTVGAKPKAKVTSVQSLRPGSPVLSAMDRSPYKEGVVYHTIVGDRGRGDTPDSSDGVVAYWSARQEGVASELVVPSAHKSYRHPEGVAELRRILREHIGHETTPAPRMASKTR